MIYKKNAFTLVEVAIGVVVFSVLLIVVIRFLAQMATLQEIL